MNSTDSLEDQFTMAEEQPTEKKLQTLLIAICTHLRLSNTDPKSTLFDLNNNNRTKRFVGSCLLRIIECYSTIIWDDAELRLKLITLMDDIYSDKLYKILKIDNKKNTHERFSVLRSVSNDCITEFEKIRTSIVSIETALKSKQTYLKLLSSPTATIFTESQIHNNSIISKERISEFFNALEQYSQANRMQKLTTFTRLGEIFNSFENDFKSHKQNNYTKAFAIDIITKTFEIAQTNFDESDLQTPASLHIAYTKRKYPLHTLNTEFQIKVDLINSGPGVAFDTRVTILDFDPSLEIEIEEISIGALDVGKHELVIKAKAVLSSTSQPQILGIITWTDYRGTQVEADFEISIEPQNGTVDWELIKYAQPYSLESIDREAELIGRKELLENISSKLSLRKSESSIIYGQKRVGKTSLARTIQNRFQLKENYTTIFIETGSLDKTSSENFIKSLGEKIIKRLQLALPLQKIENQEFQGSLYPLVSCIEDIVAATTETKIIIILDEFDEIPPQLYPYTEVGNSFFHNLRSISGESGEGRISLILVGGENMSVIMQSTDKLNKFDACNVGYFNKSEYWEDFRELLIAPLAETIEFSDDAIILLYELTEGNPFYTKFVAKTLYKKMCERRCSYISKDEMQEAIHDTIQNLEAINVNHFWSDGIRVEDSEKRDLIETQRRRFLIAFAELKRSNKKVYKTDLLSSKSLASLSAKEIIDTFISRNVLVDDGDSLRIKPKLFEKWLTEKGLHTLRASFADEDALQAFEARDNENYITDEEIIESCANWELYKGANISPSHIRTWLNQFENNTERKLAFNLMSNIKFYGELKIREKLIVIHDIIKKEVVHLIKPGERVRKDILISCFGTASKSGSSYVRMYASANNITSHSVKNYSDIQKAVQQDENIKAIVFIDDIVASGGTIEGALKDLNHDCGDLLFERGILVLVGVICGLADGIEKLEEFSATLKFKVNIKVCDIITPNDKTFSESNEIFPNQAARTATLTLARKYGSRLQNRDPLGFEDSQLLIVFKDNCPNNTLPIFWASSNDPKWIPLFKRS